MKFNEMAKMMGKEVENTVHRLQADIGVIVVEKDGGLAMMCGGTKGEFGEQVVPFLKEAIKRMQMVVDEAESGNREIVNPSAGYFVHQKATGKFIKLEDEDNGYERN